MNTDQLLEHFERISDAADAVPRLRRLVLELAVRGRLVEQRPTDAPVAELLDDIARTKAECDRRRSGNSSQKADLSVEPWCGIPASWRFARLGDVTLVTMGSSPPGSSYNTAGQGIPLINGPVEFTPGPFGQTVVNQYTTEPTVFCEKGDFLICVRGSTTGRTNIAACRACIGRGVAAVHPLFDDQFIRLAIRVRQSAILEMGRGIAFPSISRDQLVGLPIPLPPLAEQHRIVAKVDELMVLCDRLEAAQGEREARRDRLVSASLARVTEADSDDATSRKTSARFHLDHFARLTTRSEHVKQLRQTILSLAVRGRLVPQDPAEAPASDILASIATQKSTLVRDKAIARRPQIKPPTISEGGFPVPSGWEWCRLEHLIYTAGDGPHFSPKYVDPPSGVPFLSTRNITTNGFQLADMKFVSEADHREFSRKIQAAKGDVLYTKGGTTGIAIVNDLDFEFSVWVHVAILKVATEYMCSRFLAMALNSPHCYEQSQRLTHGIGNRDLGLTRMILISIPLPPLPEQRRIVAKVDELMALCDQLEASLASAATDRARLLEALLHEALAPAA